MAKGANTNQIRAEMPADLDVFKYIQKKVTATPLRHANICLMYRRRGDWPSEVPYSLFISGSINVAIDLKRGAYAFWGEIYLGFSETINIFAAEIPSLARTVAHYVDGAGYQVEEPRRSGPLTFSFSCQRISTYWIAFGENHFWPGNALKEVDSVMIVSEWKDWNTINARTFQEAMEGFNVMFADVANAIYDARETGEKRPSPRLFLIDPRTTMAQRLTHLDIEEKTGKRHTPNQDMDLSLFDFQEKS